MQIPKHSHEELLNKIIKVPLRKDEKQQIPRYFDSGDEYSGLDSADEENQL
mgnify:CR=1 FL=1